MKNAKFKNYQLDTAINARNRQAKNNFSLLQWCYNCYKDTSKEYRSKNSFIDFQHLISLTLLDNSMPISTNLLNQVHNENNM